jgi:hypothetical protein
MNSKLTLPVFGILATILSNPLSLDAQTGGRSVFQFLNLPPSARVTALAGNLITVQDDDVSLAFANPAAANPSMHHSLAFSHSFFQAKISHGYAAYAHHLDRWGITLHGGIRYLNYGTFVQTDEFGNATGEFKASEYAITLGAGRQLYEHLSVGANLKFITSSLETYQSLGLSADVAAMFHDTASRFTATLLLKNTGYQLKPYREGNREQLPFEMQIGVSKRLRYLPFRLSVIYHHLDRWNIRYDDPDAPEPTSIFGGDGVEKKTSPWLDNFFRHFTVNGEFLIGKKENLRLRLGYDHLRRKELTVNNLRSLSGFSFGAGLKINRFRLDYGYGAWHLAGGANHITISTNLQEFRR